jgi:hypothetical protein
MSSVRNVILVKYAHGCAPIASEQCARVMGALQRCPGGVCLGDQN